MIDAAAVLAWLGIPTPTDAQTADATRVLEATVNFAEGHYDLPAEYPPNVELALIMMAARLYKRKSTPEGIMAFDQNGVIRVGSFDADVDKLLSAHQNWALA